MKRLMLLAAVFAFSVAPALAETLTYDDPGKLEIKATVSLPNAQSPIQEKSKEDHKFGVIGTIAKLPFNTVRRVSDLTFEVGKETVGMLASPLEFLRKEKAAGSGLELQAPVALVAENGFDSPETIAELSAPSLDLDYTAANALRQFELESAALVASNTAQEEEPVKKGLGKSLLKVQFLLQDIGFSKDR